MARVAWTAPALSQFRKELEYVAQHSAVGAERLHAKVLQTLDRLETFPFIGWAVPEFDIEQLREILVRPYRILYVVRDDVCSIVAFIHGSRDLTRHVDPDDFLAD